MSSFSIVGQGSNAEKARGLPKGTPVRIVAVEPSKSKYPRTIQSGPRKGEQEDKWQLRVTLETMGEGETLAYTSKGPSSTKQVESRPFEAGEQFVQYYGGVYPQDGGGISLTEAGSGYAFVETLSEAGVECTGDFDDYAGIEVETDHLKGIGPAGAYVQWMPGKVLGRSEVEKPAPKTEAKAKKAEATDGDAFTALSADDQATIKEAMAEGDVSAGDLVNAGLADDEDHAKAILASAPGGKKNPLLKGD